MSVIATDSTRFSGVVKYEFEPALALCREVVTVNDAAATLRTGAVLGRYVVSPTGTATAVSGNTGNGTMGTVTVTSNKNLKLGTYQVHIVKAAANAGDFVLKDPSGTVVGNGTVAVAFNQAGLAFTLADGSTDFVVNDRFNIVVAGTEKYKLVEATATDGTEQAKAILIADVLGLSRDITLAANTDTTVLVLARGPAIVARGALQVGASVDTTPELAQVYADLKTLGIFAEVTV
jgi:hypothetical protein